eukprot:8528218-Pyramimonas_sp.AAC.1
MCALAGNGTVLWSSPRVEALGTVVVPRHVVAPLTFIHQSLRLLAAPPAFRRNIMTGELTVSATPPGPHGPQR